MKTRSDNGLRVGMVANAAGVGVQTLHYYERLGLLPKPQRSTANYRLYSSDAIRRVQFIKKAQAIGMTLEETKQILDLKDHGREPCRQVAELGEKHFAEIDARLVQLRAYRRALAKALGGWRKETATERRCAGESWRRCRNWENSIVVKLEPWLESHLSIAIVEGCAATVRSTAVVGRCVTDLHGGACRRTSQPRPAPVLSAEIHTKALRKEVEREQIHRFQ